MYKYYIACDTHYNVDEFLHLNKEKRKYSCFNNYITYEYFNYNKDIIQ